MDWRKVCLTAALFAICRFASAQAPDYGIGKAPTPEQIRAWDIAIGPAGKELPQGRGTAKEGATLYTQKGCSGCHGATGYSGGHAPTLIVRKDAKSGEPSPMCLAPCVNDANAMAIHSPYAVTLWDYINRGMPLGREGSLKPDEVYSLTAYLLFKNGVIQEDDVLDAQSLPKVKMPNRAGFALPPEWKHGTPRLAGYP